MGVPGGDTRSPPVPNTSVYPTEWVGSPAPAPCQLGDTAWSHGRVFALFSGSRLRLLCRLPHT